MDDVTHGWILEVLGAHDVREVRTLTFGISSDMRLIEADRIPLVLRRYVNDFVNELPTAIACEVQALKAARSVLGDMVPEPVAFDVTGDRSGCPSLIMTYLPGEPAIHHLDLRQIVEPLARLHARTAPNEFDRYRHWFDIDRLAVPEWTKRPEAWAELIDIVGGKEPTAPHVFLHRDFHPGNLLWQNGQLSGIVDWPASCHGPRGIDVAHARGNLALIDGVEEAEQFLRTYRQIVPSHDHDPWWDVADLLSFDSDFAGLMALNAFGAKLSIDLLHSRADEWAHALAKSV
ncbi:MAG TPA: aminoglycoside phosphotransferase family protein [Acidimicrobiales bacterium]|jgi:aminoglycoside phosphotransferase (APT) family kinase protein|nr:aminoglycoside phosphotransferase family protein [Acidimicrobiales bacterium]